MKQLIMLLMLTPGLIYAMDDNAMDHPQIWRAEKPQSPLVFEDLYDEVTKESTEIQKKPYKKTVSYVTTRVPSKTLLTCMFAHDTILLQDTEYGYMRIAIKKADQNSDRHYRLGFRTIHAKPLDMIITPEKKMHILFDFNEKSKEKYRKNNCFIAALQQPMPEFYQEYCDLFYKYDRYINKYDLLFYAGKGDKLDYDFKKNRIAVLDQEGHALTREFKDSKLNQDYAFWGRGGD